MHEMKVHNMLQAYSSQQAYSKHLRIYEKIELLEQGKIPEILII